MSVPNVDVFFADADLSTKAGRYVMYVLAVAGGFLIGNILTLILCRLAAKLILKRSINVKLERALRILGGIAVAALIAFLLYKFGPGWGFGGTGSGEGENAGGQGNENTNVKEKETPKKSEDKKKDQPVEKPPPLIVRVVILPARQFPRSYSFDGDREGIEFPAAKELLTKKVAEAKRSEVTIEIDIYQNSSNEDHDVVRQLKAFASMNKWATKVNAHQRPFE